MSVVPKPSLPMAECLNFGLGLADNDDIRQAVMQPEALFHDVLIKYMDFALPSKNQKKDVILSVNPKNSEQNTPTCSNMVSISLNEYEEKLAECNDYDSAEESKVKEDIQKNLQVPYDSALYFLPANYNKRNPWRRTIGLHVYGHELRSATYPARSSVKKLRFAQAKKPLNYLYSYFSLEVLDCDEKSSITVGICRKDYPSKIAPGKNSGSIGYNSDTGAVSICDSIQLDGPRFCKGDTVGCGIIYPSHYKRYADLSTDDNSDGMTDVVLSSMLNTNSKAMNFVCSVLNLNNAENESSSDSEVSSCEHAKDTKTLNAELNDYYNENFVESRAHVEVYFTHNMKVVGKILSYVPVGGFYPTIHVFSHSAIKMNVDLNPPVS